MPTPSIASLREFIQAQPVSRTVDHSSWSACAVGDYAREVLGHTIALPRDYDYSDVWADTVLRALMQDSGTMHTDAAEVYGVDELSDNETILDFLNAQYGVSTYGELYSHLVHYGFM